MGISLAIILPIAVLLLLFNTIQFLNFFTLLTTSGVGCCGGGESGGKRDEGGQQTQNSSSSSRKVSMVNQRGGSIMVTLSSLFSFVFVNCIGLGIILATVSAVNSRNTNNGNNNDDDTPSAATSETMLLFGRIIWIGLGALACWLVCVGANVLQFSGRRLLSYQRLDEKGSGNGLIELHRIKRDHSQVSFESMELGESSLDLDSKLKEFINDDPLQTPDDADDDDTDMGGSKSEIPAAAASRKSVSKSLSGSQRFVVLCYKRLLLRTWWSWEEYLIFKGKRAKRTLTRGQGSMAELLNVPGVNATTTNSEATPKEVDNQGEVDKQRSITPLQWNLFKIVFILAIIHIVLAVFVPLPFTKGAPSTATVLNITIIPSYYAGGLMILSASLFTFLLSQGLNLTLENNSDQAEQTEEAPTTQGPTVKITPDPSTSNAKKQMISRLGLDSYRVFEQLAWQIGILLTGSLSALLIPFSIDYGGTAVIGPDLWPLNSHFIALFVVLVTTLSVELAQALILLPFFLLAPQNNDLTKTRVHSNGHSRSPNTPDSPHHPNHPNSNRRKSNTNTETQEFVDLFTNKGQMLLLKQCLAEDLALENALFIGDLVKAHEYMRRPFSLGGVVATNHQQFIEHFSGISNYSSSNRDEGKRSVSPTSGMDNSLRKIPESLGNELELSNIEKTSSSSFSPAGQADAGRSSSKQPTNTNTNTNTNGNNHFRSKTQSSASQNSQYGKYLLQESANVTLPGRLNSNNSNNSTTSANAVSNIPAAPDAGSGGLIKFPSTRLNSSEIARNIPKGLVGPIDTHLYSSGQQVDGTPLDGSPETPLFTPGGSEIEERILQQMPASSAAFPATFEMNRQPRPAIQSNTFSSINSQNPNLLEEETTSIQMPQDSIINPNNESNENSNNNDNAKNIEKLNKLQALQRKSHQQRKLSKMIRRMYHRYVRVNSPMELNLPSSLRTCLEAEFRRLYKQRKSRRNEADGDASSSPASADSASFGELTLALFDPIKEEVARLIYSNNYRKFRERYSK